MLNGSESVYGFAGWLTTQQYKTTMSAVDDCVIIADLVKLFCDANGLPALEDGWEKRLVHPVYPLDQAVE